MQLATFKIWAEVIEIIKQNARKIGPLAFYGVFLPLVIYQLLVAFFSGKTVSQILEISSTFPYFLQVASEEMGFLVSLSFLSLGLLICCLASGFTLIDMMLHPEENARSSFKEGFRSNISTALKKGIPLLFLLSLLSVEQILFGPFRIFTCLGLMTFVLVRAEKNGLFQLFYSALSLKYTSKQITFFQVVLVLLTTVVILLLLDNCLSFVGSLFLVLDELIGFPRELFAFSLPFVPFTLPYLIFMLVSQLVYAGMFVFSVLFLVQVYLKIKLPISERI